MARRKQTRIEKFRNDLPAEYVRSLLDYCPDTGLFHWKPRRAGTKITSGHLGIKINGKWYGAHRIAWLYMTGEWPKQLVDHKNNIPDDNRFANLREATRSDNACNRTAYQTKSNLKGVAWDKQHKKWRAMIMRHGVSYKLGRFETKEEAHAAYQEAAITLHGAFARMK